MSFLSTLVERRNARSLPTALAGSGVDLFQASLGSLLGASHAGVTVNRDRALSIAAFWRGVNIIASAIGTLPLIVYEGQPGGPKRAVWNERERLVWGRPNPEVSNSTFWMTCIMQAVATGNSYIYVVTVPDRPTRRPIELWPIDSARVMVRRSKEGRKEYILDGQLEDPQHDFVDGGNIVHVAGPSLDGLVGASPVYLFARSMGLALAEEIYQATVFKEGSAPGGYLTTDQPITTEQARQLSEEWEENHKGPAKAGKIAVFGRGTKWMSASLNPVDANLFEALTWSVSEMGRILGIPEWMLGSHSKDSSWGSGLEEQNRAFIAYTLQGWLSRFQETISDELLVQTNHFAEFDVTRLTLGKMVDRVNAAKALVQVGYDPEDVLLTVGLPPMKHTGLVPVGAGAPAPASEGEGGDDGAS